jgi:hypothetical protein
MSAFLALRLPAESEIQADVHQPKPLPPVCQEWSHAKLCPRDMMECQMIPLPGCLSLPSA